MLARVHDHHDGAHHFGTRSSVRLRGFDDLEHVTRGDALTAPLVDEEILLRSGDRVRIARDEQFAGEALLDRRGTHLPRVAERLQRHRQLTVVNPAVLGDPLRQHLPGPATGDTRYPARPPGGAPRPALDGPVPTAYPQPTANL